MVGVVSKIFMILLASGNTCTQCNLNGPVHPSSGIRLDLGQAGLHGLAEALHDGHGLLLIKEFIGAIGYSIITRF